MATKRKSRPSVGAPEPNPFNYGLADKILRFLLAMNDDEIASVLVGHGFTSSELEEGWRHLRALARKDVDGLPPAERVNPSEQTVEELAAWADEWLPIVRAVTVNRLPHLREHLLEGLPSSQLKTGRKSRVSVPNDMVAALDIAKVAERILALGKGDAKKREARALLATRGLTDAMLRRALGKVESLGDGFKVPAYKPRPAVEQGAEQRASRWYLEWSSIARARIQDGRLLRRLGFGKRGRPVGSKSQPRPEEPIR